MYETAEANTKPRDSIAAIFVKLNFFYLFKNIIFKCGNIFCVGYECGFKHIAKFIYLVSTQLHFGGNRVFFIRLMLLYQLRFLIKPVGFIRFMVSEYIKNFWNPDGYPKIFFLLSLGDSLC